VKAYLKNETHLMSNSIPLLTRPSTETHKSMELSSLSGVYRLWGVLVAQAPPPLVLVTHQ